MAIKDANASDEFIFSLSRPFLRVTIANRVLDRDNGRQRCFAGKDVAENILAAAGSAGTLEDARIARLARRVVAVNDRQPGP